MAKTKSKKFHKIKIHPNRWLIWAIAYILVVSIAIIGYLNVSNINIDSENSAQNVFMAAHSYNAPSLGFGVKYPSDWSIEANSASSVTFLPSESQDTGVTVLVTAPTAEKFIRKDLKIISEGRTTLDTGGAARIINDLGLGHFETVILALHNKKLYVVRGSDNFVEKLLPTFRFLPIIK